MDSKADDIWVHFEDIGNTSAKCKLCQKTYSVRNASNLKSHLERSHNIPANVKGTTAAAPHQVLITSTTLPTDELLGYSSTMKAQAILSENSDTDTQNNSQTANNTESSDIEQFPGKIVSLLDEAAKDKSPRTRSTRRRIKRPSLRGSLRINTDEDFGRLISKKMQLLPFAIRCGLEVDILRMVNGALNKIDEL